MAADYVLRTPSGAAAKKAFDIVITRSIEMGAKGSRKFHYFAFLSEAGDSPRMLGAVPEKEIRIRIPEGAKPSFANRFLHSPQRFFMLRFRLDGQGRAMAINLHEEYNRATPECILQPLFKAVCKDLEGEGATSLNMGQLRRGRRNGIPFGKIGPLVDARIKKSGYLLEQVPGSG